MPTYKFDDDIPGMIEGFGVPVTLDGVAGLGIVDYADSLDMQDAGLVGVINKAITIIVQTSAFAATVSNDAVGKPVTIEGKPYIVRERLQQSDGALTRLVVTEAQ